jgi:preprotein translocase subunit YajC
MIGAMIVTGAVIGIVYFAIVRRREKQEEKFERRKW